MVSTRRRKRSNSTTTPPPKPPPAASANDDDDDNNESDDAPEPMITDTPSSTSRRSNSSRRTSTTAKDTPPIKTKKFSPRLTRSARKKKQQQEEKEKAQELQAKENDNDDTDEVDEVVKTTKSTRKKKKNQVDELQEIQEEAEEETESKSDDEPESKNEEKDISESESNDSSDKEEEEEDGNAFFSDENAKWLKPKNKSSSTNKSTNNKKELLSSDDEDEDDDDDEMLVDNNDEFDGSSSTGSNDEDDEDDDDESLLSIERESRLLDKEIAEEKRLAKEDFEQSINLLDGANKAYHLPTAEELEEELEGTRVVPPSELNERIQNILQVLNDFKARREHGRSRSEYMERLSSDMAELFGYLPELIDYFLGMLGPHETMQFLEASDMQRPVVIRTNTLKVRRKDLAQSLLKRGVNLDPLADWSKVGLKIYESPVPLGATPEYLAGHYMLQSAASMCPVLALDPPPKSKVLDISSAPGGKTSYISQLMKNTGMILANDLRPDRQKATIGNMHRLGCRNVIVACHDGRKLGKLFPNKFDRILLDAPCSGLGVISRDPSVKVQRTIPDVMRTAHLQKELLLSAIDALSCKKGKGGNGGGIMVYSTCSVSVAENEEVVNYILRKRDVKIIDTGLDFGKPGFTRYQQKRFHPSTVLTRRFYPHVHNMDGFYVCKLQKMSNWKHGQDDGDKEEVDAVDVAVDDGEDVNAVEVDKQDKNEQKKSTPKKEPATASLVVPNNKKNKKKKNKKVLKRKGDGRGDGQVESDVNNKKRKVSVPPKLTEQQKQEAASAKNKNKKNNKNRNMTNAKMNKPRRPKKDATKVMDQ
eukprot:CAMPEP_0178969416 /NCGR_PEP_ID=MMETSP0789-20121207/18850_1 /TAXON_ID=3005 /ORGANISM="Rhizosolenia setigera, Strain CCMP 1694" /LENGTH=816 /DNA_ID=CAMNT_0020655559 /DNA_START=29 /DNA_END=2479 /DNA_ORIENTATION=+